jgi:Mce-associated membrane protein
VRAEIDTATEPDEGTLADVTATQDSPDVDESETTGDAANAEGAAEPDGTASADTSVEEDHTEDTEGAKPLPRRRRIRWSRLAVFWVLPILALSLAAAAGYLKWQGTSVRESGTAGIEAVAAAKDSTVALLSYQPDSVEKDLGAGRDRLAGKFKDSYTQLAHDVVIPGAKKQHISAVATVPAAALVSATPNHAVALVYVNQTVTVGNEAPSDTASSVRVTLDKVGGRWLISAFDPV